jgi:hypothetical protein
LVAAELANSWPGATMAENPNKTARQQRDDEVSAAIRNSAV